MHGVFLLCGWFLIAPCQSLLPSKLVSLSVDQVFSVYGSNGNFSLNSLKQLMKDLNVSPIGSAIQKDAVLSNTTSELQYVLSCAARNTTVDDVDHCFSRQCLSAEQFFLLLEVSLDASLLPEDIQTISPILVAHASNTRCSLNTIDGSRAHERSDSRPSRAEIWGYGLLSVTIISIGSLIGAFLLPVSKTRCYKHLLTTMVALAVGALSGTAVYFLIPDGFGLSESPDFSDYVFKSTTIIGGIYLLFMTERAIKLILRAKSRQRKPVKEFFAEDDWHEQAERLGNTDTESYANRGHHKSESSSRFLALDANDSQPSSPPNGNSATSNGRARSISQTSGRSLSLHEVGIVAWMIVFGDGLHNFVDGLAIGSAFSQNPLTGVSVSLAILCEELPHELGDFAVLLRSGMSIRRALLFNFLSACLCYIGLVIGILLGELETATPWVLVMAGGMFLYIALTDLLPEMNEQVDHDDQDRGWPAARLVLLQNIGLFLGWGSIMLMSLYGHNIEL